jgi:5-methyltetrahydrofolate--homocysteine methyltransferase
MIIVGENINTSRKKIARAVESKDAAFIKEAARRQAEAGAHYIDVNAGTFVDRETQCLCWLVETVQDEVSLPLCLDSPNPDAIAEAMKYHKGEPMINSISLERGRFEGLLPVVTSRPCSIVALCMGRTSMPSNVEDRVQSGSEIIQLLTGKGVPVEKIYVDPLVQPVSVDTRMGLVVMETIRLIMEHFPGVNTICGLSNISFGLPERRLINHTFFSLCAASGLSAAILDPTDRQLLATLLAAEMLLDRDEYCERFIEAYQDGRFTRG